MDLGFTSRLPHSIGVCNVEVTRLEVPMKAAVERIPGSRCLICEDKLSRGFDCVQDTT